MPSRRPIPPEDPRTTPSGQSLDGAYGYLILRAARLLRYQFTSLAGAAETPLSPEQWILLNRLFEEDGLSQQELCDQSFNDRSNLTRILASMERNGLVRRRRDPGDARRQMIFITAKGRGMRERFWPVVTEARELVYRGLGPSHLSHLQEIVSVLERNIVGG